jgi:hypothetical protein
VPTDRIGMPEILAHFGEILPRRSPRDPVPDFQLCGTIGMASDEFANSPPADHPQALCSHNENIRAIPASVGLNPPLTPVVTERLFLRHRSRKFANIAKVARRKLRMLDDAEKLEDVAAVPGSRFEPLAGGRKGRYSNLHVVRCLFPPPKADPPLIVDPDAQASYELEVAEDQLGKAVVREVLPRSAA